MRFSLPVTVNVRAVLLVGVAVIRVADSVGAVRSTVTVAASTSLAGLRFPTASLTASGAKIVAYGAAAKANTLMCWCPEAAAVMRYVLDRSPHKQGTLLPGTRIPVCAPERIFETRPDYVLILPWNLKDENSPSFARRSQIAAVRSRSFSKSDSNFS